MSEARREANDLFFGAGDPDHGYDEEGNFAVRVVFLDGVDRTHAQTNSLRWALAQADQYRAVLRQKGYGHTRVHVGVIDEDDPERGELDWDCVGG